MVLPPRLVRELDWVENYWPNTRKGKGHVYPKVQLYCLMGVTGAWTVGFNHIYLQYIRIPFRTGMSTLQVPPFITTSFAAPRCVLISNHLGNTLTATKIFYFIRPSPENLAAYERWSGTELQNHSWLGDLVDNVFKVELTQGNTMIIPTGWIHAVVGILFLSFGCWLIMT